MVVVAAGGDKRRLAAIALGELEAEHAAIKPQRALQIGDLEVHMPDTDAGIDRPGLWSAAAWVAVVGEAFISMTPDA
jgi:hypothetical protein